MNESGQEQRGHTKKKISEAVEADNNPCYKEQHLSYKCLSSNNYDASKCYIPFENYKQCKAFWNTIRIERMRNGIEPLIPREDEREEILRNRFKGKKEL